MSFAPPIRLGLAEWGYDERAFDGASYLYVHQDVREEIGYDVEGAWRHWTGAGHEQGRFAPGLGRASPRHVDLQARADRPFGLNVFGPFAAVSGLGTAARNLLDAVRASGISFEARPYDVETGRAEITTAEQARPVVFRFNLVLANADQIRRLAGLYPDGTFDDAYTIAVWAWELAAFRADWHASFALVDEIWTNSRFELAAISALSPVPVHLMPLPVPAPAPVDRRVGRARFGFADDAFVILCAFDAGSTEARKNPFASIEAFKAAFGTDPRRILVVKHHGASAELVGRLRSARDGAGNIRLIGGRLQQPEHLLLQGACDALLSMHRSEGFGLNLAEFLAAGRVVIGTDYAGSRDFLDDEVGFPVAARLVCVERRTGPYPPDAVWAEADHLSCVAALHEAASGGEAVEARQAAARRRMATEFSPEAIGGRLRARIEAIDGQAAATEDGLAATALASLAVHVNPDPARSAIEWPARLPTFTLVAADSVEAADDLARQTYPFWELCVLWSGPPPASRHDLRVRHLDRASCHRMPVIAAAEAGSGGWLVVFPDGIALRQDALLEIARALDSDEPPDVLSFGDEPFSTSGPVAIRKSSLLSAWSEDGSLAGTLTRLAESARVAHLPGLSDRDDGVPAARLPGGSRIATRTRHPVRADHVRDVLMMPDQDVRAQARSIRRGDAAEHVLLVLDDSEPPSADEAGLLAGWLAGSGAAVVRQGGRILTRRTVLGRVAAEGGDATDFPDAIGRLDMDGVVLPLTPGLVVPAGRRTRDEVDTPAEHAERLRALGLFDADHYLVSSPDVAASGVDALSHYVEYGWLENRAPNFYFDPVWYRARYMADDPDEVLDPLLHYARFRNSGVRPARHFDPAWVRRSCHLRPGVDPLRYFLERRRTEDVSPLPEFDPAYYRARRRDIAYRQVDPFEHYMRFGATEGVNPSPNFDTAFYAARHMRDVARRDPVASNPLLHYLEHRDQQPAVTSLKAALRQEIARLQLLGRAFIEMSFCWYDGLPQRVDALRTYLAEPSLSMPFLLVFANEFLAVAAERAADERLLSALRLPLVDDYDDGDICARLAECFADPRCLRRDGRPVLAVVRGDAAVPAFAARIARLLEAEHGVAVRLELLD